MWESPGYPPGGVNEAMRKINKIIAPKLIGMDARKQGLIDQTNA